MADREVEKFWISGDRVFFNLVSKLSNQAITLVFVLIFFFYGFWLDVTNTGNGERESGNECTAVTRLRIQNGGGNDVYKH